MAPSFHPLLLLTFSFALSYALPSASQSGACERVRDSTVKPPFTEVNNTSATPLPNPTGTLKYIQLGLGFQNYTCNANTAVPTGTYVQTVPSSGAIANLYDITRLVTPHTSDSYTKSALKAFQTCLDATRCTPSLANDYCQTCHQIATVAYQKDASGRHFFAPINGAQTPNFDISARNDFLSSKRVANAKAPAAAYDGENGLGAIDWLYLADNGDGLTRGLKSVYRLETAGGVAPSSCTTPGGQVQVPYAAEYWFYN